MRVLSCEEPQKVVEKQLESPMEMEMEMEMEESNSSQSSSSRNQWTSGERLKKFSRLLLDGIKDFFKWFSPTFCCATIFVTLLELHVRHYWKIGFTANFLVTLGSKYLLYSIVLPLDQEIRQRITLNLSTFVSLVFADLPYVLAYVDLEMCPSFFTALGLISLAICCLTVADIVVFNMHTLRCLQLQLYSQLYWQSCLRFLVFAGLIVAGITNIIEKAWHGDIAFHKHAILLSLCVFSFIRFREPCRRLRKMGKRAMIVVPVVEEKDD